MNLQIRNTIEQHKTSQQHGEVSCIGKEVELATAHVLSQSSMLCLCLNDALPLNNSDSGLF